MGKTSVEQEQLTHKSGPDSQSGASSAIGSTQHRRMAQTISQDIQNLVEANERMYVTIDEKDSQLKYAMEEQARMQKMIEELQIQSNT